jgi:hypothetical protein
MKIRKFNCPDCGAAKVNPYKSPYVCCDYCGGWIDLDATLWTEILGDGKRLKKFEELQERILVKTRKAINEKKRDLYLMAQQDYFNSFYNIYPEFIPPIVGKGEIFKKFLRIKAEWNTDLKFDDALNLKKKRGASERALQNLQSPKEPHVDFFAVFIETAETFHQYLRHEMEVKKTNPKYELLTTLYPVSFEYKMRMALFANAWIMRLNDTERQHFQKKYGLEHAYVEIPLPETKQVTCNKCSHTITAPKGAIRCFCENCNELSIIENHVNCSNCGMENALPETWSLLINCTGCGTEIRILRHA